MENEVNSPNPIAAQVVDNAQQPNANGVPGSLPGETKAETVARLYKVTVDGEEMEVDEDELRRGYAHNKAASKRMEEAAMSRKEAEQVLRLFKESPREAFRLLGRDARQFAEQVINEELSEALLSPQERELRNYKRELEKYQNQEKQARAEYEKQVMEQEMARYTEKIQSDIIGTLETAGLPKTERTVGRIAYYMQAALQAGYNDVKPSDVIDHVKNDYISDFKSFMGSMSEDQIEMFLGSDVVKKVAKSTVKGGKAPQPVPKSVNENRSRKSEEKTVKSPRDFFKNL